MKPIVIMITGASGACYGLRLVETLLVANRPVTLILSDAGRKVLNFETELNWPSRISELQSVVRNHFSAGEELCVYAPDDLFAPVASGSSAPQAVVVVPCSMGTLGRIRETPLHSIHLENMLRLSNAGAIIAPAMPAFYHKPEGIEGLVDFMTGKLLDLLGVEQHLFPRWGAQEQDAQ